MAKMKPGLSHSNRTVPVVAFKSNRLGGDARSRIGNAPGQRWKDSVQGQTLSVHQRDLVRMINNASNSLTAYATNSSSANVATRLLVPDLKLQFGERIKAVGQSAELGAWYLDAAPLLQWTEGDNWVHHLQLPTGHHEFKLLIARDNGTTHWEQGPNRTIEARPVPDSIEGIYEVKCQFEFTTGTETSTIPFPVKEKDEKAIQKGAAGSKHTSGRKSNSGSSHRAFDNDIISGSDLPDAMEGDSTEREPDTLQDAKNIPKRYSWEQDPKKDEKGKDEEAMEGVNPPSSDPVKETEPAADDKSVQGSSHFSFNGKGPELIVSPLREQSSWSVSAQVVLKDGSPDQSVDLSKHELNIVTKPVREANGRAVRVFGGAEAKEMEDGSVLVKFPPDGEGEDILTLVERLLGYYEDQEGCH